MATLFSARFQSGTVTSGKTVDVKIEYKSTSDTRLLLHWDAEDFRVSPNSADLAASGRTTETITLTITKIGNSSLCEIDFQLGTDDDPDHELDVVLVN